MTETVSGPEAAEPNYLQWTPVIAGALAATALSLILVTFAATIGLGVSSTAPTWRDTSAALWILSGVYLILQAIVSFGFEHILPVVFDDLLLLVLPTKSKVATAFTAWRSGRWRWFLVRRWPRSLPLPH
jgi:hypothetical protein